MIGNPDFELNAENIDRLVDGELSDSDRRCLLQLCDRSPEQWRNVAIAFVESQVLSDEFRQFSNLRAERSVVTKTTDEPTGCDAPTSISSVQIIRNKASYLGTAAAVLLAVGIGFGVGSLSNLFHPANQVATGESESRPENSKNADTQPSNESVLMLVQDRNTGGLKPVEIPISNQKNVDLRSPRFEEWIQSLRQEGFDVEHSQQFYPFELPGGRQMVLPVDGIKVNAKQYQ